ncbi:ribose 5-phosphate isomerase A [Clostridium felsineum]|uniref:Ribose 5-phosphate isomerase A n=1 Tax=Clostridium felsineum TaxID=36839 RepID=A0A1S8LID9_9CLOT|nr:ribose 5-phosphate isomerase A [Clostridium felsineum]URZ05501.1 Ribose-5-phosphate isomerase A [Clostridium felsineum]URZ10540.1 Ribose-5-phosphate isomerase A [Clostridium felsineum]
MDEEILRKLCAKKAVEYIKNNFIVGLGAGRNIACLIELISKENLKIKVVTPSDNTRKLCFKYGIEVIEACLVDKVDVAFDGCCEVDEDFYASKGAGGVFTKEKIVGAMAKEYILLIDKSKLKKKLTFKFPVALEIVKDSLKYVCRSVSELGGEFSVRTSNNKDGYLITEDGNLLLDVKFENIDDFKKLNFDLKNITGVIETSIFTTEVTKLILAAYDGVKVISRGDVK